MTPPLILPYPPSLNAMYRSVSVRGRVMTLLSAEARQYKLRAATACLGKAKPLSCLVVVSMVAYRPRKTGDLDNTLKAVLDSLRGVLFQDDSQVVEIHARRMDDKSNPRVEIRVTPAEGEAP